MDHSKQAADIFNKLADLYESKFMDVSTYSSQLDMFLHMLHKPDASILEIGCGPGNITRHLLQKNNQLKIHGIDLAPNMIELAIRNCPAATFEVLDCRELSSIQGQFDAVICGFCLPYLNMEESSALLGNIASLLHNDGALYLSTIEGEYERSGFRKGSTGDEIFMHYYSAETISVLLSGHGFTNITFEKAVDRSNPAGDVDLVFLARKNARLY